MRAPSGIVSFALLASVLLALPAPVVGANAVREPFGYRTKGMTHEVYGFLRSSELAWAADHLDLDAVSTIAFFGVRADRYGHLVKRTASGTVTAGWAAWTGSTMGRLLARAHAAGTKVVLTVELLGWDAVGYATTDALLGSGTARRTLAREIADAVVARGADGVNIDLEPLPSGRRNEFTTWMREIRAALDTKARGYQLVFDALGNFSAWDIAGATGRGAADAVLAMAYTYRGVRTSNAGSTAPFRASGYDVRDTIDAYLAVIPGSKLIVGNPLFSYRYPTQSGDAHAATTGAGRATRYSTAMGYAARYGLLWDDKEQSGWVRWQERACSTCPLQWWQLFFDDLRTQRLKYDYLKARGARGVGLWALGFEGSRTDVALELERAFRPGG